MHARLNLPRWPTAPRRAFCAAVACSTALCVVAAAGAADWLEFRGPLGRAIAADQPIRTRWSADDGIAWKADLPGRAASSGARQDRLHILALDRNTGRVRWHRTFWATDRTLCHPTSAIAAGTPASDGTRIIDGTVVVQIDCQGDAFASGIDAVSGEDRWSVSRERLGCWSSPLAIDTAAHGACVLLQNAAGVEVRRIADGTIVWSWKLRCAEIPTTTEAAGRLYVPSDGIAALSPALPAGGAEDAVKPEWRSTKLSCGMASPIAWGDSIAAINRAGVLSIGSTTDGAIRAQVRLAGSFWASPLLVGTMLVAANTEGKTFLVSTDGEPKIIAENELPGTFTATPAVADGSVYLRSETALWKVAAP